MSDKLRDRLLAAIMAFLMALLGMQTATTVGGCGKGPAIPECPEPKPDPKPEPKPDPKPEPTKDPIQAIGKVVMGGGYCSGTIVGPPRDDKHWTIISASHCFSRVGEKVTFLTRSGRSIPCTVIAIDKQSDGAVMMTDTREDDLPWVYLAASTPPAGTKIFHAGFGVHNPANVERGEVRGGPDAKGQTRYWLSVSQGDSGGGIMYTEEGKLLSPVCCTTRLNAPGDVWGASPEKMTAMIATPTNFIDLAPIDMPIRVAPEPGVNEPPE